MKKITVLLVLSFSPLVVLAANDLGDVLGAFLGVLNLFIPLLLTLALLALFYGGIKLIAGAGDEKGRAEGIQIMLWGVIGLFVMISVWGLIGLLQEDFLGGGEAEVIKAPRAL